MVYKEMEGGGSFEQKDRQWQETIETLDWREVRREALHNMVEPIILLTRKIAESKEQEKKRGKMEKLENIPINYELITLERILDGICAAQHLRVGERTCPCKQCEPSSDILNHDVQHDIGAVILFEPDIHQVEWSRSIPEKYTKVKVLEPFIGDNLLREIINPLTVIPLDVTQSDEHSTI
jgi:hypothetical protein